MAVIRYLLAILVLIFCFAIPFIAYSAAVTLAWDPNSEPNLAGYKVYYGTASRSYSASVSVGTATTCTLSGLVAGRTYYFSATAFSSDAGESAYSQEVSYTVPGTDALDTTLDPPLLLSPAGGEPADSAPWLQVQQPSSLTPGDFQLATCWQIFRENDGLCVLDVETEPGLTDLKVPRLVLEEGRSYFWRARFSDSQGAFSEWSGPGHFSVRAGSGDLNADGIPDVLAVETGLDLDGDGIADLLQAGLKAVKAAGGSRRVALSIEGSATALAIEALQSADPDDPDYAGPGRPQSMSFGVISFRIRVAQPGATLAARLFFSEPVPAEARWYEFDPATAAWHDASAQASFGPDRRSAALTLEDGGPWDADGVANGYIIASAGAGIPPAGPTSSFGSGSSGGGGGGGCFIASACEQSTAPAALMMLSLAGALGCGVLVKARSPAAGSRRQQAAGLWLSPAAAPASAAPAGPRRSRSARRAKRSSACSGWRLKICGNTYTRSGLRAAAPLRSAT